MLDLISNRIKEVIILILGIIVVVLALYSYAVTSTKNAINNDLIRIKSYIDLTTENTKKEIQIVEKEVVKIEKVYVPKKEYITKFVKVENETDCNASQRIIHDFEF